MHSAGSEGRKEKRETSSRDATVEHSISSFPSKPERHWDRQIVTLGLKLNSNDAGGWGAGLGVSVLLVVAWLRKLWGPHNVP